MYDNIGRKIKELALIIAILNFVLYTISGIVVIAINLTLVLVGLLIIIMGAILSYVSSFLLYGFGQLIENSDITVNCLQNIASMNNVTITKNQNNSKSKNRSLKNNLSNNFITEIKSTCTDDLELIFSDQQDLYTSDELSYIQEELERRKFNK